MSGSSGNLLGNVIAALKGIEFGGRLDTTAPQKMRPSTSSSIQRINDENLRSTKTDARAVTVKRKLSRPISTQSKRVPLATLSAASDSIAAINVNVGHKNRSLEDSIEKSVDLDIHEWLRDIRDKTRCKSPINYEHIFDPFLTHYLQA